MELKWLEDLLVLLESGSFSEAAERRNVTQPAFSRRIRALETWLGVTLVDRDRKPLRFTKIALANEAEMRRLVNQIYELRNRLQADLKSGPRILLTSQHSLTVTYLPQLIQFLLGHDVHFPYQLRSANKDECVGALARGEVDLLLCYETRRHPTGLGETAVQRILLDSDELSPIASPSLAAKIKTFDSQQPIPFLAYTEQSFFGQMMRAEILPDLGQRHSLETVCVSAFSVALRELVGNDMGVAWLPRALVQKDLKSGHLVDLGSDLGVCPMQISLYGPAAGMPPEVLEIWTVLDEFPKPLRLINSFPTGSSKTDSSALPSS